MTIINTQEELEQHLKQAREDIAYWRVVSFEFMKNKLALMKEEKTLCMK